MLIIAYNLCDENNVCGTIAGAYNAATCLKPYCIETGCFLGAWMHRICTISIYVKRTFFFPHGSIKLFVSKIYFLLRVALAGRFRPQCGDAAVMGSLAGRLTNLRDVLQPAACSGVSWG